MTTTAIDYTPTQPWPKGVNLKWRGNSTIVGRHGVRNQCAFEASSVRHTIRGEGRTIADAEAMAWSHWERIHNCDEHDFVPTGLGGTGGVCRHCQLFMPNVFEEIDAELVGV